MAKEILTETVEVEPTAGSKDQVRALGHQDERAEIDGIFEGGPLTRWERKFGLSRSRERRLVVRALIAIAIGWVPLALINAIQLIVMRDEAAETFFWDVAVHTRFLVAVPLLIAAESDCIPRLRQVTRHFLAAGLIREQDRHRYSAAVASTQRLLNSTTAEIIMVALAYGLVVAISNYVTPAQIPPWHRAGTVFYYFSLDGWWHALVSIPLLTVLCFGWVWRVLLWARLLWLIARLDLKLLPYHPDHVAGLRFMSTSLRGFRFLGFALATIAAGVVSNRVLLDGASPFDFKFVPFAMVILVILLAAGPLSVFIGKLRETHGKAMFTYGALADEWGEHFKRKWVDQAGALERGLEARDFSATTGFFRVVENAYEMNEMPIGKNDLFELIFVTLLPFVPVALMAIPFEEFLQKLLKFVL